MPKYVAIRSFDQIIIHPSEVFLDEVTFASLHFDRKVAESQRLIGTQAEMQRLIGMQVKTGLEGNKAFAKPCKGDLLLAPHGAFAFSKSCRDGLLLRSLRSMVNRKGAETHWNASRDAEAYWNAGKDDWKATRPSPSPVWATFC